MPIQAHNERWQLFLRQLQWLVKLKAADQTQKTIQITPDYSKKKKKKLHWLLKNAARSHPVQMDGGASLAFMPPIKNFCGISTLPQPRSNNALCLEWMGKGQVVPCPPFSTFIMFPRYLKQNKNCVCHAKLDSLLILLHTCIFFFLASQKQQQKKYPIACDRPNTVSDVRFSSIFSPGIPGTIKSNKINRKDEYIPCLQQNLLL